MLCKFVLSEKDIKRLDEYVNSGLSDLNNVENIGDILTKIIKQAGYNDRPFSVTDVQLTALDELLVITGAEYSKLVINALNIKRTIPLRKLSYNEALKIIQYGNENLRNKRPKVTKSVEDILMDDSVSKAQVIGIMYDALSTMQRYNGDTVAHCLIEAIKGSDIIYEE